MITSRILFLEKFISQPQKIGSITPSSLFLAEKMLGDLPWDEIETIVELGAGNGVFTGYIAQNKTPDCQVLIIEQDLEMRQDLQNRFPWFYYGTKAEKLTSILRQYGLSQAECIVSGLPFATFSKKQRHKIIEAVIGSLKQGGSFIAFQYSLQMRETLKKYFSEVKIGFVFLNLPPAFIYYCRK